MFGKEIVEREDEQLQKFEGKTEKDLKTAPIFAKHAFLATEARDLTYSRMSRQNRAKFFFEIIRFF